MNVNNHKKQNFTRLLEENNYVLLVPPSHWSPPTIYKSDELFGFRVLMSEVNYKQTNFIDAEIYFLLPLNGYPFIPVLV